MGKCRRKPFSFRVLVLDPRKRKGSLLLTLMPILSEKFFEQNLFERSFITGSKNVEIHLKFLARTLEFFEIQRICKDTIYDGYFIGE